MASHFVPKTSWQYISAVTLVALALLLATPGVRAQTTPPQSFFDPFNKIDTKRWYISDGWVNGNWHGCTWARSNLVIKDGILQLQLTKAPSKFRNYKCAEIRTLSRYGYGIYEVSMRSAAGAGLNTAMFTYSGPPLTPVHDEIDFEFLGKSPSNVQLNYYVMGKNMGETSPAVGSDASRSFHSYAFEWTPTAMAWYIDGKLVRTVTGGVQPKTPGQFFASLWMGSDQLNDWLGKFVDERNLITADIDWIAYTAPGQRCKFPQSLSCSRP